MTYDQIQTIILLLILATSLLAILWHLRFEHWLNIESWANTQDRQEHRKDFDYILRDRARADAELHSLKKAILDEGAITRQRIAQVKTRLADEERDDQDNKRGQRAQT